MSETSRREVLRAASLFAGLAPLGCLGNLIQEDKSSELEKKILDLEAKLKDAPKDRKIAQELATAHYQMGSKLYEQEDKTANKNAQRVLDLITEKDLAYKGIEAHIGKSNFILGKNYLSENNSEKGLNHMYQAVVWCEGKQSDAAVTAVVDHYEKSGVHHIVREFKRGRFYKGKLLKKLQENLEESTRTGDFRWVIEGKDAEDSEHTINFYHQLAVYTLAREREKSRKDRDHLYPINHFFRSISIAHHTLKDKERVLANARAIYPSLKNTFDDLPSLEKAYANWALQMLSDKKNSIPGIKPLLEALAKRKEY